MASEWSSILVVLSGNEPILHPLAQVCVEVSLADRPAFDVQQATAGHVTPGAHLCWAFVEAGLQARPAWRSASAPTQVSCGVERVANERTQAGSVWTSAGGGSEKTPPASNFAASSQGVSRAGSSERGQWISSGRRSGEAQRHRAAETAGVRPAKAQPNAFIVGLASSASASMGSARSFKWAKIGRESSSGSTSRNGLPAARCAAAASDSRLHARCPRSRGSARAPRRP